MGFFTKDVAGPQQALEPLSRERITALLDAGGQNYGTDDDGDVGGYWDGHLFFFLVLGQDGEYLQVRGRWNREVDLDRTAALQEHVNRWNAERLWPKAYVVPAGDQVAVYAEHAVDYEHGVTDKQLELHMMCAISTSLQLFDELDQAYPEEAAAGRAAFEAAQSRAEQH